jgi:transposase InsO family protein
LAHGKNEAKNFFVEDNLLFHKDKIAGHSVKQLCLPKERIDKVLSLAHDAAFAGHMALKTTKDRIKLNFWFPNMENIVKEYCESCDICQRHAPLRIAQRVPITPIPRNDETRFGCLVADCIGPIVTNVDPTSPKPEYNYALVAVDQFSRWPMAYPLKALTAKATCDAYMQIFTTFGFPKTIRSDNGSNFNSKLTQEFLRRMGCSPRFGPVAHPESQGLVERCNATLKTMIHKLAEDNPKGWHKLLPYVLWSLRERPSATTHVSPYTLVYGTLPKGPLSVLSEEWAGERDAPLDLGAGAAAYLDQLRDNLEMSKLYAEYYSDIEQQRYATHYNLRSMDRRYEVGDKVIIQSPEARGAKKDGQWQGPAVITQVKSPYTYIVERGG